MRTIISLCIVFCLAASLSLAETPEEIAALKIENERLRTENEKLKIENIQWRAWYEYLTKLCIQHGIDYNNPGSQKKPTIASKKTQDGAWAGFRGIKWETDLESLPDVLKQKEDKAMTYCVREADPMTIGNATLRSIVYVFYKERFFSVTIRTDGLTNWTALKDATFATYGQGKRPNPYIEQWWWGGGIGPVAPRVLMTLEYNEFSTEGALTMLYEPFLREQEREDAKAAKDAKKDF